MYSENHNQSVGSEHFPQYSYQTGKQLWLSTFNILSHQTVNRNRMNKIRSLKVPAAILR